MGNRNMKVGLRNCRSYFKILDGADILGMLPYLRGEKSNGEEIFTFSHP